MTRSGPVVASVLSVLLVAGCKSEAAKRVEELDAAVSWLSTVEAVALRWADNRVPVRYAERTIEEARDALVKSGQGDAARVTAATFATVQRRNRGGVAAAIAAVHAQREVLEARLDAAKHSQ